MLRSPGKVKNPCKICHLPVSNKNGLRCMGACKKWAHYKCLDYTPGKIQDIKAGLLKVNCPCPDCDYEPKEQYKTMSNLCGKELCPAARPPVCEVKTCPRNLCSGATQTKKCPLGCEPNQFAQDNSKSIQKSDKMCLKRAGESPSLDKERSNSCDKLPVLSKCSPITIPSNLSPPKCPSPNSLPPKSPPPNCPTPKFSPLKSFLPNCKPPKCFLHKPAQKKNTYPSKNSSPVDSRQKIECPPPVTSEKDCAKPTSKKQICSNKNCPSLNSNVSLRGSKSLCNSLVPSNTSDSICCRKMDEVCASNSDPTMPLSPAEARKALLNTIEEMCDTVGNFSRQFKNLMGEMMSALEHCP